MNRLHSETVSLRFASSTEDYLTTSLYTSLSWNGAFAGSDETSRLHTIRHGDEIVAWTVTHRMDERSANPVYDAPTIAGGSAAGSPESWYPQLLLGARNGQCNPMNGEHARGRAALHELIASVRSVRASSMTWLYADTETAQTLIDLEMGFVPYLTEMDATIPLNFSDFDGYVASLNSKRRNAARKELELSGGLPAMHPIDTSDSALLSRCAGLATQTQARHGHSASEEGMRMYLEKCVSAGFEAVAFIYGPVDCPSAFSLALVAANRLWVRLVGLDYGPSGDTQGRYPGVLAYGPVAFGALRGLEAVNLGAGNAAFKRHRGAQNSARWSLLFPPAGVSIDTEAVRVANSQAARRLGVVDAERLHSPYDLIS